MNNQFSVDQFRVQFDKDIKALGKAEKITKDLLRDMSRTTLEATQQTEDIQYINRLIKELTPVNRRTAVLFFKEHSGFKWEEEERQFGKKDKKRYDAIKAKAVEALEDPHFNIWSWAEKNVQIEAKPFEISKVTQFIKNALKKADEQGIPQKLVLRAVFDGGFDVESLALMLEEMTHKEEEVEQIEARI